MTRSKHHNDMHLLASRYAGRPAIVQGAGGNISAKVNEEIMLVKASGREFGDIGSRGEGVVPVFYRKLGAYLLGDASERDTEQDRLSAVRACTDPASGSERPSMEVWFHTLLPRYVLHTHSVYVNLFACTHEGVDLFSRVMNESSMRWCFIPYCNPGYELGRAVSEQLKVFKEAPQVFFLENHGIITAANSDHECASLHDFAEEKIKEALDMNNAFFDMSSLSGEEIDDFNSLVLFPDQVIYPEHGAIRAAHRFLLKHIRRNGLHVKGLTADQKEALLNMDSEQHRRSLQAMR